MSSPTSNSSKQTVHSASSTQSFSVALYGNTPVRRVGMEGEERPKTTAAWACSRAAVRASGVLGMRDWAEDGWSDEEGREEEGVEFGTRVESARTGGLVEPLIAASMQSLMWASLRASG
jgi:hypothetical protein